MKAKGNVFKNKRVLMEYIHKKKAEKKRSKELSDQAEARRNKVKNARTRREERQAQKRAEILQAYAKEDSTAAPPEADSREREKVAGVHPNFFGERFRPLSNFSSVHEWRKAVKSEWAADDADALEKAAGDVDDDYAGRSAVEQHFLYGNDVFNLGHPVDGAKDNGGTVFGDLRVKGPGDGAPMPAFPRDTNAMERHPWTDQAHVFYDERGPETGGIVGSRPYNTSIETV